MTFNRIGELRSLMECGEDVEIVVIRPTGWSHKQARQYTTTQPLKGVVVHAVAYSEHSSPSELRRFVRLVEPSTVVPTVYSDSNFDRLKALYADLVKVPPRSSILSHFRLRASQVLVSEEVQVSTTTAVLSTVKTAAETADVKDDTPSGEPVTAGVKRKLTMLDFFTGRSRR